MYEKSDQGKSDSCLSVLCDDGNMQIQTGNAASEQPDYSSGLGISNVLSTPILPSIVNTESQYSDETSINVHQSESGSNYAVTSCQPSENVTQTNENMYSSSGNSTSYFNPTEEISQSCSQSSNGNTIADICPSDNGHSFKTENAYSKGDSGSSSTDSGMFGTNVEMSDQSTYSAPNYSSGASLAMPLPSTEYPKRESDTESCSRFEDSGDRHFSDSALGQVSERNFKNGSFSATICQSNKSDLSDQNGECQIHDSGMENSVRFESFQICSFLPFCLDGSYLAIRGNEILDGTNLLDSSSVFSFNDGFRQTST